MRELLIHIVTYRPISCSNDDDDDDDRLLLAQQLR